MSVLESPSSEPKRKTVQEKFEDQKSGVYAVIITKIREQILEKSTINDVEYYEGRLEYLRSLSPNAREIALRMPEFRKFLFEEIDAGSLKDLSSLKPHDHQKGKNEANILLDLVNILQKYHNKPHGEGVSESALDTALRTQNQVSYGSSDENLIPTCSLQSIEIAGLFHDFDHSGEIGGDDFEKNIRPAMNAAFVFMKQYGYSKRQILEVLCMIYATTSFSDIDPHTLQEAIMVFADLTGGIRSGWDGFLEECSRVYAELVSRPKNFEEWYTRTRGFLDTYLPQKLSVCKLRGIPADVLQEAENGRKYCLEQLDLMKTTKSEEEKETFFRTKSQKQ